MWYGVSEYLLAALVLAAMAHAFVRSYLVGTFGGAVVCSILNLLHEAIPVGGDVNLGWLPPMFIAGFLLALPVFAAVGIPLAAIRFLRKYARRDKLMAVDRAALLGRLAAFRAAENGALPPG